MEKQIVIHLVSASSSLVIKNLVGLVFNQFSNIETKLYHWDLINSSASLDLAMEKISQKPGLIFYHIVDENLEKELLVKSSNNGIKAISATNDVIDKVADTLNIQRQRNNGIDKLDDGYFNKIENIDFSIKHDDGQNINTISQADIILVGLSRSSKTPTSMYLAFNGFKVANIPFINEASLERYLLKMRGNLVVGLIVNPSRLMHIRESRLPNLGHDLCNDYVDLTEIRNECRVLREICTKHSWPIVDVTAKSVEETAAGVVKIYYGDNRKNP